MGRENGEEKWREVKNKGITNIGGTLYEGSVLKRFFFL